MALSMNDVMGISLTGDQKRVKSQMVRNFLHSALNEERGVPLRYPENFGWNL